VRALRARGHERVVLLGLCAGAWIALRGADGAARGVIALNPQMYWARATRSRRCSQTRACGAPPSGGARSAAGGGRVERARPARSAQLVGRWLDGLAASGNHVAMVFAEDDDGIEYLRNRVRRRFERVRRPGLIRVVEIPEIDHSMHRAWLRGRMLDTIRQQLDTFAAAAR